MDERLWQQIIDERAITRVLNDYCRAADRWDLRLMRSCFHDEAIDDHGIFCGPIDEFIAFLQQAFEHGGPVTRTMHTISNLIIEIEGDVAHTECHGIFYLGMEDETGEYDQLSGGRYCDRLEKRNDLWKIAYRRVVYEWSRMDPRGKSGWELFDIANFTFGQRDKSDYIYQRQTSVPLKP